MDNNKKIMLLEAATYLYIADMITMKERDMVFKRINSAFNGVSSEGDK